MTIGKLQALLSGLIVAVFVVVTAVIALTPVIGGYPPDPYTEHLKTFSSLYSGVVGLVLGYYFGHHRTKEGK